MKPPVKKPAPLPLSETILWHFSIDKDVKHVGAIATLDQLFANHEVEDILKTSAKALLQQSGGKALSANCTKEKWFGLPNPMSTLAFSGHMTGLAKTLSYARENDIDINQPISMCGGPLHAAVYGDQPDTLRYLMDAGASLAMEDEDGSTPFMLALLKSVRCARVIWPRYKSFSLLTQNEKGYTALHLAAIGNAGEFVERLITCMERVDQSDNEGNNALLLAVASSNLTTLHSFWAYRKHIGYCDINYLGNNMLHVAAMRKWADAVALIISDSDLDLDDENNDLDTALHIVCAANEQKCAELLLLENCEALSYNKRSYSAICEAIVAGHRDLAEYLLSSLNDEELESYTDRFIYMLLDESHRQQVKLAHKEDALHSIIYYLYWSEHTRHIMIEAALFRPWLEQIAQRYNEDTEKLGTWLGYVTCILSTQEWDKRSQRRLIEQFVSCRSPVYILRLMKHFNSIGAHLAASYFLMPLMCFGQSDVGDTWLTENYHHILTFMSHFDANRSSFKCTPDLNDGFEKLWSHFKQKVHDTQAIESEKHAAELLAMVADEKEKEKKKAKKKSKAKKKNEMKLDSDVQATGNQNELGKDTLTSKNKSTSLNTSKVLDQDKKGSDHIRQRTDEKISNAEGEPGKMEWAAVQTVTPAEHMIVIDESWDVAFQITRSHESPTSGEWMTIGRKQAKNPTKKVGDLEKTSLNPQATQSNKSSSVTKPSNKTISEKTKQPRRGGENKADSDSNWRTRECIGPTKATKNPHPQHGNKLKVPNTAGNADADKWRKEGNKQAKLPDLSHNEKEIGAGSKRKNKKMEECKSSTTKSTPHTQNCNNNVKNRNRTDPKPSSSSEFPLSLKVNTSNCSASNVISGNSKAPVAIRNNIVAEMQSNIVTIKPLVEEGGSNDNISKEINLINEAIDVSLCENDNPVNTRDIRRVQVNVDTKCNRLKNTNVPNMKSSIVNEATGVPEKDEFVNTKNSSGNVYHQVQVMAPSMYIDNRAGPFYNSDPQSTIPPLNAGIHLSPYVPMWAGVFNTPVTSSNDLLDEMVESQYDNGIPTGGNINYLNYNETIVPRTGMESQNRRDPDPKDESVHDICQSEGLPSRGAYCIPKVMEVASSREKLNINTSQTCLPVCNTMNFKSRPTTGNHDNMAACSSHGNEAPSVYTDDHCPGLGAKNRHFVSAEIQFMHSTTPEELSLQEEEEDCSAMIGQPVHISDISFMSDSMLSAYDGNESMPEEIKGHSVVTTDCGIPDEPSLSDLSWLARGMLNWNCESFDQFGMGTPPDHTNRHGMTNSPVQNISSDFDHGVALTKVKDQVCINPNLDDELEENEKVTEVFSQTGNHEDIRRFNVCMQLDHQPQAGNMSSKLNESSIPVRSFVDKIVVNALTKLHSIAEEDSTTSIEDESNCSAVPDISQTDVTSSNATGTSLTYDNSSANDADISDNDAEVMYYTAQNPVNEPCHVHKPQQTTHNVDDSVDVIIRTSSPTISGKPAANMNHSLNMSPIPEGGPPNLDGTAVVGICRPIVWHPDAGEIMTGTAHNGTGDGVPPVSVPTSMKHNDNIMKMEDSLATRCLMKDTEYITDTDRIDVEMSTPLKNYFFANGEGDCSSSDWKVSNGIKTESTDIVSPLRRNLEILSNRKLNESSFAELNPDHDMWLDKQPDNYLPGLRYINKKWIGDGLFAISQNPVNSVIEKQWRCVGHEKVLDHVGGGDYTDLLLYHGMQDGPGQQQIISPCKIDHQKGRRLLPLHLLSDGESDKERSEEAIEVSITSFVSNGADISSAYVPWSVGANPAECSAQDVLGLEEDVSPSYCPLSGANTHVDSSSEKRVDVKVGQVRGKPVARVLPTAESTPSGSGYTHVEDWRTGQQIPTIITARHERFTEHNNLETIACGEDIQSDEQGTYGSEALYVNRLSNAWGKKMTDFMALHYTSRRHVGQLNFSTSPHFTMGTSTFRDTIMLGCHDNGMELAIKRTTLTVARTMRELLDELPEVVRVHDRLLPCTAVYQDRQYGYLAMPLGEANLRSHIHDLKSRHQLSLALQRPLAAQILEGLAFLHQHSVVHGRLSPSNVLIDIEGGVRLADFGTNMKHKYRLMPRDEVKRYWRSSEVAVTGDLEAGKLSDVQVAGMLFYYIMTGGEHPCGRSPAEAQVNITRGWPKPREISMDVDSMLDCMLAFMPRARPSAQEVLSSIFFWNDQKRYKFLVAVAKVYLKKSNNNLRTHQDLINRTNCLRLPELRQGKTWLDVLDRYLLKEMTSQGRLYTPHLTSLLRFIENTVSHRAMMSPASHQMLLAPAQYFLARFASLPSLLYHKLTKDELSKVLRHM